MFLDDYLKYTEQQESPKIFHTWVAFSMVGAALGRNIWLDMGFYRIIPNLFVILVGKTASVRKTTAIKIGIDLYKQANTKTKILAQKLSPERLLQALQVNDENVKEVDIEQLAEDGIESRGYLIAPELSVLLG